MRIYEIEINEKPDEGYEMMEKIESNVEQNKIMIQSNFNQCKQYNFHQGKQGTELQRIKIKPDQTVLYDKNKKNIVKTSLHMELI